MLKWLGAYIGLEHVITYTLRRLVIECNVISVVGTLCCLGNDDKDAGLWTDVQHRRRFFSSMFPLQQAAPEDAEPVDMQPGRSICFSGLSKHSEPKANTSGQKARRCTVVGGSRMFAFRSDQFYFLATK